MSRPLCVACGKNYAAINYIRNNCTHYRSRCGDCIRKNRNKKPSKKIWQRCGYQKKNRCDRCGFHSNINEVFNVYFIDGSLKNIKPNNLATVCSNCQIILRYSQTQWVWGDLVEDF